VRTNGLTKDELDYFSARRRHAWLLRHREKLTYDEVGKRLGVTLGRARQMIIKVDREDGRGRTAWW